MRSYDSMRMIIERVGNAKLYHRTRDIESFRQIVDGNFNFHMSGGEPDNMPQKARHRGLDRFISFGRSVNSSYIGPATKLRTDAYIFEFDWNLLKRDFLLQSIDYWGDRGREEEERLFTAERSLDLSKYVTGIHIVYNDARNNYDIKDARRMLKKWEDDVAAILKYHDDEIDTDQLQYVRNQVDGWKQKISRMEQAEMRIIRYVKGLSSNLGDIPVWLHTDMKAFKAHRWAEAEQINPNLPMEDDDDDE